MGLCCWPQVRVHDPAPTVCAQDVRPARFEGVHRLPDAHFCHGFGQDRGHLGSFFAVLAG